MSFNLARGGNVVSPYFVRGSLNEFSISQLQPFAIGDVAEENPQRVGDAPDEQAAESEEHGQANADIAEIETVNAEHAERES